MKELSDPNLIIFVSVVGTWFLALIWALGKRKPVSPEPYREGIQVVDNVRRML